MNKLFAVLLLFCVSQLYSQDFKVVHVNGSIVAESTKKPLTRGTTFNKSEKFQYKTNDARAVVINPKAGKRYILKGSGSEGYINANLTPSMGNIAPRAGALNNRLDLKNHFDGKYVIIGKLEVVINSLAFPMSDTQFFYINFIYHGESVDKELQYHGDTLIINKDSLLRVDGKIINNEDISEMKLMYYSKTNSKPVRMAISNTFYPVFPDEKEFKEEVDIILESLPKEKDRVQAILDYINDIYGKPNKLNVKTWYDASYKD